MATIKYFNTTTQEWEAVSSATSGLEGVGTEKISVQNEAPADPAIGDIWIDSDEPFEAGGAGGFVAQPEPPEDTDVLWYDTDDDSGGVVTSNADTVDGIHASLTPEAGKLVPLDDSAKFSGSVMPSGTVLFRGIDTRVGSGTVIPVTDTTYASVTATSTGGQILLSFSAHIKDGNSGAPRYGYIQVLCDGAVVGDIMEWHTSVSGNSSADPHLIVSHTPTAASHTWALRVRAGVASASLIYQAYLLVQEVQA